MHHAGPVASTGPGRVHATAEVDRETVDAAATWLDAVARRTGHGADGRVYLEDALPVRRDQQTASSGMKHHRPGDSPSPLRTATSVRRLGSTMESLPSAAPDLPAATTYSKLSSPTTAKPAAKPVSGIESGVLTPQHSNDVSQLGPAGTPPTRLLLTTNTRLPTNTTARGKTPAATLVVSPVK